MLFAEGDIGQGANGDLDGWILRMPDLPDRLRSELLDFAERLLRPLGAGLFV